MRKIKCLMFVLPCLLILGCTSTSKDVSDSGYPESRKPSGETYDGAMSTETLSPRELKKEKAKIGRELAVCLKSNPDSICVGQLNEKYMSILTRQKAYFVQKLAANWEGNQGLIRSLNESNRKTYRELYGLCEYASTSEFGGSLSALILYHCINEGFDLISNIIKTSYQIGQGITDGGPRMTTEQYKDGNKFFENQLNFYITSTIKSTEEDLSSGKLENEERQALQAILKALAEIRPSMNNLIGTYCGANNSNSSLKGFSNSPDRQKLIEAYCEYQLRAFAEGQFPVEEGEGG